MEDKTEAPERVVFDIDELVEKAVENKLAKIKEEEVHKAEESIILKNDLLGISTVISSHKTGVNDLMKMAQDNMLWAIKHTPTKRALGYD